MIKPKQLTDVKFLPLHFGWKDSDLSNRFEILL